MMGLGMSWITRGGPTSWPPPGLPGQGPSRGVVQRPLGAVGDTHSGYMSSGGWWLLSGSCDKDCGASALGGRGRAGSPGERCGAVWWW